MQCDTMQGATMARKHMVWDMLTAPIREACACISGLVVEYIAAIDVARDRCPVAEFGQPYCATLESTLSTRSIVSLCPPSPQYYIEANTPTPLPRVCSSTYQKSDSCGVRAHALSEWRLEPPP